MAKIDVWVRCEPCDGTGRLPSKTAVLGPRCGYCGGDGKVLKEADFDGISSARWFGESWGAGICEPETHVETPVGEVCLHCKEEIKDGDQGLLMACVAERVTMEPVHLDCFAKSLGFDQPKGQ